ncbi:S8 family serine peptidase [Kutzneria buriramensis]|uniref:Subtilisin family serine protease n=1 Tax=Kutzneria buriramensis TaxID=1045776 RepID=A0A3E0I6D1_9PSEU|nr:S8 family serine peptidase [Kutzneria buriramensis]REH54171.1 subtilisin family serine protease [Kutzneria buriramensis]
MFRQQRRRLVLVVATVTGVLAATGPNAMAAGAAAADAALAQGSKQPVIVVLKNQHPELSPKAQRGQRQQTVGKEQAPLVTQAKQVGAQNVKAFDVLNGFSAKVTDAEASKLAANPDVAAVVPDRARAVKPLDATQKAAIKATPPPDQPLAAGACPTDPAKPILEPEALQTTHTAYTNPTLPQAQNIVDGKGVSVAWIADGLDPNNPDFIRADGSHVFTDYQDFSGTDPNGPQSGEEAFGDASSIAAQGRVTYDLSNVVAAAHPLPKGCTVTVRGIAPGASLVGLNVFGSAELVTNSIILQAIDYAVNTDNVDVINESLGGNPFPADGVDPVALANDAAVAAGVTVVASTGDAGPSGTIGTPAVDPHVISAGSVTNYRLYAQTGERGARTFAKTWANDNMSSLSSGGVDDLGRVPDLVAPGESGWSVCSADKRFAGCTDEQGRPSNIRTFGGTSEASPFIAGGAALVIEAYKNTHHGAKPSPQLVKQILTSTATDLGQPADEQGAGELNTYAAVRTAESIQDGNGKPKAQGAGLLATTGGGDTQLTAAAKPGTNVTKPLTITNTSPNTQTVSAHGRVLGKTLADTTSSIALDVNSPQTPIFIDGTSATRAYAKTTFQVPFGADHLQGDLAWPGTPAQSQTIRMALIDPNGVYQSDSRPQNSSSKSDHGRVDVKNPAPGAWTAVFYATQAANGFKGNIAYEFTSTKYTNFGSVSPSTLTLKPGQSGTFQVTAKTPGTPGDLSAAVELDTPLGAVSSVPFTLRSLITPDSGGAFSGTIVGGNGRDFAPAQTQTYWFDVPAGKKDFGLDVSLGGDPNQTVYAALKSPSGQILSLSTNQQPGGGGTVLTKSMQSYVRAPEKGRWELVINVSQGVSGTALSQQFTGHLKYNVVDATVTGLPSGTVPAGKPIKVKVKVHNNGVAPEAIFADPRLTTETDQALLVIPPTSAAQQFPQPATATGTEWLVPTEARSLTIQQNATVTADFDASAFSGVPEVYGQPRGTSATGSTAASEITQGQWLAVATVVGPTNATVTGSATLAAQVHAQAFDTSATSDTGDLWRLGVDAGAPNFTPTTLAPGQTATITVTITPTGAKGTTVSGVLYVDNFNGVLLSGDELAGVPYSYTIG